jgi:hypothetical protein
MQVCNHPDLFEPRPIASAFVPASIEYRTSPMIFLNLGENPLQYISSSILQISHWDYDPILIESVRKLQISEEKFFDVYIDDINLDKPPYLSKTAIYDGFISQLRKDAVNVSLDRRKFNFAINERRCAGDVFGVHWRLIQKFILPPRTAEKALLARRDGRARYELPLLWFQLVKTVEDRIDEWKDIIERFVFVRLKAKAAPVEIVTRSPNTSTMHSKLNWSPDAELQLACAVKASKVPYYNIDIRREINFPDRKLVQFDSGKLQTLHILLRDLKKGNHKCLIFTQMSKMLDILEIFLNLHGHTYVRLDGSTTVEKRQKLMDRFNGDPKLFCFILSTRSGGFGINLTGADSVIFYDSDWNPAMDAQAQDRAHRIGQTREVHIYRLVCSSTVEENILTKAKQKRHLDYLVMTEGNFSEATLFNSHNMQDILGLSSSTSGADLSSKSGKKLEVEDSAPLDGNSAEIEAAMAAAEDEEDVSAMRGAQQELKKEGEEFDENAPVESNEDGAGDEKEEADIEKDDETVEKKSNVIVPVASSEDADVEAEFASWQSKIGADFKAIESALKPVERFAFRMHTEVEPYYSLHYVMDQQRLNEVVEETGGLSHEEQEWNIAEIERVKQEEEEKALADGELLWAPMTYRDMRKLKHWFLSERAKRQGAIRRRLITGEAWQEVVDAVTQIPFWYNEDTGDASYNVPPVILEQRRLAIAKEKRFGALPPDALITLFSLLTPMERITASEVCIYWNTSASDDVFKLRVLPVEAGSTDSYRDGKDKNGSKVYSSLASAVKAATAGDTIVLGPGHYWEETIDISIPLKIIGDMSDPARCVIEFTGRLNVINSCRAVMICGVTIRRPRKIPGAKSIIFVRGSTLQVRSAHLCSHRPTITVHVTSYIFATLTIRMVLAVLFFVETKH